MVIEYSNPIPIPNGTPAADSFLIGFLKPGSLQQNQRENCSVHYKSNPERGNQTKKITSHDYSRNHGKNNWKNSSEGFFDILFSSESKHHGVHYGFDENIDGIDYFVGENEYRQGN